MPSPSPGGLSFPPTAWNVLVAARDPDAPGAREAREEICAAYRPPIYAYIRALGLGHEDAEDVTQKLLAGICHDGWLARVDESHGRMRHFFKATARHAVSNHLRELHAAKRGGGKANLPLEEIMTSEEPAVRAHSEAAFDRQWAWTVFDRAVRGLEENYRARGREALFVALKSTLISNETLQPLAEIGSELGMAQSQLRIETHRLRRRMAVRLREEVAATLPPGATVAEIEAETRHLVQTLAHEPAA